MVRKSQKRITKRVLIIVATFLILGFVGGIVLIKRNATTPSMTVQQDDRDAQTTSDIPSAQPDYNGDASANENKDPGNTIHENQGIASVTDNVGAESSDTSTPQLSATGEITVYLPYKNQVLKNNQEISGTSSLTRVNYRLIDSISGVIATGTLQVADGKFSGTLSYSTAASEGRLDIFGTKSDASEFSAVEIPVRFK